MSTLRPFLALAACLTLSTLVAAGDATTLEQRLAKLEESLETARVAAHIPGMSIAVVQDDEVIWARGFGVADVASKRPADAQTLYAVGSTTKAFTSTLIGMLVDSGDASWDDPVTRHLPYFDLQVRSDDEDAECTLRDLLSHRHGFTRMGILMIGGQASRDEVLHAAAGAEPWDDFRQGFHYSNVMYLAAGQSAGVAAGSTWDEMMGERIFKPLKMNASNVHLATAQADERMALGYKWDRARKELDHKPMLDLATIAPAGAVNSNVLDMAQWIRLQLGRGEVDGVRLISAESLRETWSPQIEMGDGRSYGLGWMLQEHDGRQLVEHGGNIDGFSAQVGLCPEENLGYVLLMNLDGAPLRQASLSMVFDTLLDEAPAEEVVAGETPLDFDDYVGLYTANFGTFREADFEIQVNGDKLAVNIPGQQTLDLKTPDAQGRWYAVLTDRVAVSFDRDAEGAVRGLRMHSNGFKFEVPRKGTEISPEVPAEQLEKYVGSYVRTEGGKRIKIFLLKGRLAIEDKGQHLSFHTPDADGHAALRAREEQGATFQSDAEGAIESLIFHGSAGDRLFMRLAEGADTKLPTVAEVLALRNTDARKAAQAGGTKLSGEAWVVQAGIRGSLTTFTQGTERHAVHMDFGKFGRISTVARDKQAWSYTGMRGLDELQGDELTQAILAHPGAVDGDWNAYFDTIEVTASDMLNDRAVYVVRLKKGDLPSHTYRVDVETGDVLRVNQINLEASMRIPVTITYSKFEERDGIRVPMHIEIENPASGKIIWTVQSIESGLELGDEVFTLEDPGAK